MGVVSMLMDMSSELVHSLLPMYVVGTLGASMVTLGFIEGIAEATASVVKVFSGIASDVARRRKIIVVLGYGLSALTKPLFPLASAVWVVMGGRFIDRIGKGIRGAPRDALVADMVAPEQRGAAYGLRQALDTVGAILGPLMAIVLMMVLVDDLRVALWVAVVPAVAAVVVLTTAVREPKAPSVSSPHTTRFRFGSVRDLPKQYWRVVGFGGVLALARFSEAFVILRAQDVGLATTYVPGVMIVMNVVYAAAAYPAGAAADRMSPRYILLAGLASLVAADVLLASVATPFGVLAGSAFWGLNMAFTQGTLSKLVADAAPEAVRGSAFGYYNVVNGGAVLLASVIAGSLWSMLGPAATFIAGAVFATLAMVGLMVVRTNR